MKMKKLCALLLAVLMTAVSLIGCSSKSSDTQGAATNVTTEESRTTEAASGKTKTTDAGEGESGKWEYKEAELTMLIEVGMNLGGIQAVCDLAEEKLGIKVDIEKPGVENVVKTRLASGDMADICGYNSGSLLSSLNPSEYFLDLTNEEWTDKLDDAYKASVTVDGVVYGIPISSTQAGAILYNKEIYKKYNLEIPKTWDEYMENCEILKNAGETAIIGSYADSWTSQLLLLGDYYNVQSLEPDFAKNFEAGKLKYATTPVALRSFEKLAQTNQYYNKDYLATSYDQACDMLVNGEGASWIMLSLALSNIYELYGDEVNNIGMFPIPGDNPDDNGLTVWMPCSFYGNKSSDKIDDIKRFMEFYVSEEALDAYTSAVLPDGPYCVKGYELPDKAYDAVKESQQYFDSGKIATALEFQTAVKGSNSPAICQACGSGQATAQESAQAYDEDCKKQAVQLGLDWK